jgi:hypothetical protein
MKETEQPTFPFLFAVRDFNADADSEKRILYHLISRLQNGTCFPSQKKMAYEEQTTEKTVKRAIRALKAKGVITVEKHGRNNVYRLHLDAIKEHQLPPMPDEPEKPRTATGVSVGKAEQGTPMSPIEEPETDSEQGTSMTPIPAIGDICDQNRGHQNPRKKKEKKTFKEKKTKHVSIPTTRTPDEGEIFSSEGQGTRGRVNPTLPTGMPTKPQTTLEHAKKILDTYEGVIDLSEPVICADCTRIGKVVDGRCAFRDDDGTVCGGTRLMNKLEWLNTIRDQWDAYNKALRNLAGVPLKETVGTLRVDSMERQDEIIKCRRAATPMSMEKRRHWAKQLYDSGNRFRVRTAWYMWASGMLDDDTVEMEPWVTQLFTDLEALKPRDGETK